MAHLQESLSGVRIVTAHNRQRRNVAEHRTIVHALPRRQRRHRHRRGDLRRHHRDRRHGRPGRDPRDRRALGARRHDGDRPAGGLHPLPHRVLRADPAARAALQHVPAGSGVGAQAPRPARRGAVGRRPARRAGPARAGGGGAARGRGVRVRPRPPGAARRRPGDPRRRDASPSSGRPAPASPPSPSSSTASTTPTAGRVLLDGIDVRDVTLRSVRRQVGTVPQEPFLFGGSIRDERQLRPARRVGGRGARGVPPRRTRRPARPAARRASTRPCTSGACRCHQASGSSSRWRARSSPARGSSCSTRRRRTST